MNYINILKSHKIKIIIGIIILVIGILVLKNKSSSNVKDFTINRADISESIEVAGKIKPSAESDLNFERSGVISSIPIKVGQRVYKGQSLATLSSADLVAQVSEATASVESAQATLDSITQGSRPEEIAVKQQILDSANSDYELQKTQSIDTFNNTTNSYNDILYFKLNNFFLQSADSYKYNVNNCDQTLSSKIENNYTNAIKDYKDLKALDSAYIENILNISKNQIELKNLINNISSAVTSNCVINDTSLNSYKAYVSSAKTIMTQTTNEINARIYSINSAKSAIDKAKKDLTLSQAGGDKNKINTQKAVLSQAQARLQSAEAQLSKNILRAPFEGIITAVNIDLGELAAATKSAVSIMSESGFELEVKLSEIDAAKIVSGQAADITLDAFGNDMHWPGSVSRVDPSATEVNGVANYKAIISFMKASSTNMDKVKSGMTANAKLITNTKKGALVISNKYIKTVGGKTMATVKDTQSSKYREKEITIGIRGDSGLIEVLSGLIEGDEVKMVVK